MMNSSSHSRTVAFCLAAAVASLAGVALLLLGLPEAALAASGITVAFAGGALFHAHRLGRTLAEVTTVCRAIAKGDFESRILGPIDKGDIGAMQLAINDMIDRCDAFVREASASMMAVCNNKFYRLIRPEGLNGVLGIAAATINSATEAVRDRVAAFDRSAVAFETSVLGIIESLGGASKSMDQTAETLTAGASTTRELATAVAAASEEATVNMQTVAAATTELNDTAAEIAHEVRRSNEIAKQAVTKVEGANQSVRGLRDAANHIGDVVRLITAIAEQTNLLALNATIEAARAGEAGRGFAVVAQEVKALAGQTAKATHEISEHINEVQNSTHSAVEAIEGIGTIISEVADLTGHVALAVDSQTQATTEIARNIEQAFAGMRDITGNVHGVNENARGTADMAAITKDSSLKLLDESGMLSKEIRAFLSNMRQGMFDRRKRDDADYKGPDRRAAGRAAASDNREKRVA